jgi:putative transposase
VKPYDLNRFCAVLAREYDFTRKLNSQARQAAAERAAAAITRFYTHCREKKPGKKGYPHFQHDCRSVEYKQTGWRLDATGTHLTLLDGHQAGTFKLQGTQDVRVYGHEQVKRVRILRRADGYYTQFIIDAERRQAVAATGQTVGIDLGLSHFSTDSVGEVVANPRHLRKSEQALKRLQRRVSHKAKGGKNRARARGRLARKHLKVSRQRRDFAVKAARALVMSNDVIAYENLRVAHLLKNRHLAKSISDAGWRQFLHWLDYLAHVYGKVAVGVPPQYTSQDCSGCGKRVQKALSERTHVCPACGLVLDRDHNAALNILALGLRRLAETTAGHAESNAWGPDTLYPSAATLVGKVAG